MSSDHTQRASWFPRIMSGVATVVLATSTPSINAQEDTGDRNIFELSPFEVDASKDTGYMANNTLAGSRLNMKLSDSSAAISVFTKEFLTDIGADSLEDVLRYSNNSVRMDETEESGGNQVQEFEFQFSIRGLPASRSVNYFLWDAISTDNYNLSRIDESRGPNSILFGVGSAGGVVNTSTKRARFNDLNRVEFMIGSVKRYRSAIDINRVLIEDKLAIRFNGMIDEAETWRLWEYKDQVRGHLALTYRAAEQTVLRGEAEVGQVNDNLARSYLGDDYVFEWIAAGSPDRSEPGITRNSQRRDRYIYVDNDSKVGFSGSGNNYYTNVGGGDRFKISEESDLFPFTANPGGPDNIRETDYSTYSVYLEQGIGDNFNFELAFNHQSSRFKQYDSLGGSYSLRGDVSEADKTNHHKEFFYETNWAGRERQRSADTFRATASYELDLGESLGYHRFAAMYESRDSSSARNSTTEALMDSNGILRVPIEPGDSQTAGANGLYRRHYITPGDHKTYYVGSWRDDFSIDIDGVTYRNGFVQRNFNVADDSQSLSAGLVSMQNFWLHEKVVTTFGYREDDITIRKRGVTQDPTTQNFIVDYENPPSVSSFSGGTSTVGIVVKPTDWLSVFYNDSDNKGLPDVNRIVLPNDTFADPSEGDGKDVGIMFDLLDGSVFARVAYYESSMFGLTRFGTRGNVENPNFRILDTLLDAGLIDATEYAEHAVITNTHTFGRDSSGYEGQLTANITPNWSVRLNYSITDRVVFDVMPEVVSWFNEENAFWRSFGDTVYYNYDENGVAGQGPYDVSGGNNSIAEESFDRPEELIADRTAFNGLGDAGSRKYQGNLFTNYRFSEGFLRGFNIGGGVRYLGAMSAAADIVKKEILWGNDKTLIDLMLGYNTNATFLGPKVDVKFQLNIKNLTDSRESTIAGMQLDGRISRITFQTPRELQFRTTLSF